ncbi:hypothetical protein [Rhizobium rhizogenes]|uniref:hypothetical protein n=1 Tax=Rhizobium rhizogenes TaxID=359 RepID=UPI0024BE8135|nr:hypothetical protein [Rhizobium rhizogenes]MDJ1638191.1 hypothetical protein [Rhizobium rhizogenes]
MAGAGGSALIACQRAYVGKYAGLDFHLHRPDQRFSRRKACHCAITHFSGHEIKQAFTEHDIGAHAVAEKAACDPERKIDSTGIRDNDLKTLKILKK